MDPLVQNYLRTKLKEQETISRKKQSELLISLGLYNKEYSDIHGFSAEYPEHEWDEQAGTVRFFKKVPVQVTPEEYTAIQKIEEQQNKKGDEILNFLDKQNQRGEEIIKFLDRQKSADDRILNFLSQHEAKPESDDSSISRNAVSVIFKVLAWILFIGGFIAGIVFGRVEVTQGYYYTYTEMEFSFVIALVYWAASFVSGMVFLGFAEIIQLLDDIKKK